MILSFYAEIKTPSGMTAADAQMCEEDMERVLKGWIDPVDHQPVMVRLVATFDNLTCREIRFCILRLNEQSLKQIMREKGL